MRLIKLSVLFLLLMSGLCFSDEPASQGDESSNSSAEKAPQGKGETLRGVALSWIQVGAEQFKRGLYEQAEQAFLSASQYQEYLSAQENKNLEDRINKTRSAIVERKVVSDNIQQAKDLIDKGQPIKARAYYEKVRNSPYLTDIERRQIADELKKIDSSFDKQNKDVTDLYNRSIELYRAGEIEKAREGFAQVAKSDLLVTPKGQSPEDYLLQIDGILTAQLKPESSEKPVSKQPSRRYGVQQMPPEENKPEPPAVSDNTNNNHNISELDLLKLPPAAQNNEQQNPQKEMAEVASVAEPPLVTEKPEPQLQQDKAKAKEKIIRTYTRAVVGNAETRVQAYIDKGEFNKAVTVIHNAASVVRENRPIIGDELFVQYSARLKQLTDKIIEAGNTH